MPDEPKKSPESGVNPDLTRTASGSEAAIPDSAPQHAPVPKRVGRYTVMGVLGEGGMGTVYEAQQENPKRAVAVKVIRAGYLSPALLRRFSQESQVLGRLQHPGIAQVYEAGTVQDERGQNLPFFAMEFIVGEPLTAYAQRKSLGVRELLDLLARVCDAVYHAHQKGVIHRDLKPGNILVDESGQPKILDFGVARATDSDIQQTTLQTDIGQLIGTLPYMSPEQVSGNPDDLDTRSDVYALGVIAYELLAKRLPYNLQRKMIHEAARIIKEEEPTRLSSISRTLRGDIETIVSKALEKDKSRRYQSAESLASDIRRYLRDETIAARPASTWYQIQKFSRRNRGLVSGLAAAFFLLVVGLIGTTYGMRQAIKARDSEVAARKEADIQKQVAVTARQSEAQQRVVAESQRDKAEKIADFMGQTLQGAGPSVATGRDITMLKEMMDTAADRIKNGELKSAPEAEIHLRQTIGRAYTDLSLYPEAAQMLEPAAEMARKISPGDDPEKATALFQLAFLKQQRGELAAAEPIYREVLAMRRRLFPGDNDGIANALTQLGILLQDRNDMAGAESFARESLEMRQRLYKGDNQDVAIGLNCLSRIRKARGDLAGAEPLLRESVEMERRLFPGDHPDLATGIANLGQMRLNRGDPDAAEPLIRESLAMMKRLYKGDNEGIAFNMRNLAHLLQNRGDLAAAEPLFRDALAMDKRLFTGDHASLAGDIQNMGLLYQIRGNLPDAETEFRESLEMNRRLYPGDHQNISASLNNLAFVLLARGNPAAAEPLAREATAMSERLTGKDSYPTGNARLKLGRALLALNRFSEAEPELIETERVLGSASGVPPARHEQAVEAMVQLYDSWDKAEPGKGLDAKAAEWRNKLEP